MVTGSLEGRIHRQAKQAFDDSGRVKLVSDFSPGPEDLCGDRAQVMSILRLY